MAIRAPGALIPLQHGRGTTGDAGKNWRKDGARRSNVPDLMATEAVAAPPAPPNRGAVLGIALRLIASAALVALAWFAINENLTDTRAELLANRGNQMAMRDSHLRGQADLRQALRMQPGHPTFQMWLADALIRFENQKALGGNPQSINFANLREAYDLMAAAQAGYLRPSAITMRVAQSAGMVAQYAAQTGNTAEREFYGKAALDNYLLYVREQGFPVASPDIFYEGAIRAAMELGRPDVALALWDDRAMYLRPPPPPSANLLATVQRARRQMGEFHAMVAATVQNLMARPDRMDLHAELATTARQQRLVRPAAITFDELHRAAAMPTAARQYLQEFPL